MELLFAFGCALGRSWNMGHWTRISLPAAMVLGLSPGLCVASDVTRPGGFPDCPDPATVAIAYRDEVLGKASLLRPESLLYGKVELWPTAAERSGCTGKFSTARAAISVNYTPIPMEPGLVLFKLDAGTGMHGNLITLDLTLEDSTGAPTTLSRQVWTLDASLGEMGRRSVGERIEETQTVRRGPPDRLTLTLVATDRQDRYVTDLRREEVSVRLKSRRLPDDAMQDLVPPSPESPIRLLVLVDVSTFLEKGESRSRFNARYRGFIDRVILDGFAALAGHIRDSAPPVPVVEVGLVRYALSAQWREDTFWRADQGLPASTAEPMREFLMTPPPASWLATGATDADAALDAMRRLWHYFEGRRALLVLPQGTEVYTGRGLHAFLPPQRDETQIGTEPIEVIAEQIASGDPASVRHVLQHTERRYPSVYALVPNVMVRNQGRGHGWFRLLAEATGGVWEAEGRGGLPREFSEILQLAYDDLRNGHTLKVEIPNEDQVPGWKSITVTTGRNGVTLRAPTLYEASGSICNYLRSYLITEDPITRLVAASEAGVCWEHTALQGFLMARLYGDAQREDNPFVREELYRSLIEVTFRLLQHPSREMRRDAGRNLRALLERSDQDDTLRATYRGIAERLRDR